LAASRSLGGGLASLAAALAPGGEFFHDQAETRLGEAQWLLAGEQDHRHQISGTGQKKRAGAADQIHQHETADAAADHSAGAVEIAAFRPVLEKKVRRVEPCGTREQQDAKADHRAWPDAAVEGQFHHAKPDEANRQQACGGTEKQDLQEAENPAQRAYQIVAGGTGFAGECFQNPPAWQIRRAVFHQREQQQQAGCDP
jgi:hypothetical protein